MSRSGDSSSKHGDDSFAWKYDDADDCASDEAVPSEESAPERGEGKPRSSAPVTTAAAAVNGTINITGDPHKIVHSLEESASSTDGSSAVHLMKAAKDELTASVSADPVAQHIAEGFRINYWTMQDAVSGRILWHSGTDWDEGMFDSELQAHVPADILNCPAVSREINFSSREEMQHFRLEQRVYYKGILMEEWFFDFGFVIPGSTNTWQSTIESAGDGNMLPASLLSGHVQIVTSFFDGPLFVSKSTVRVFYDR